MTTNGFVNVQSIVNVKWNETFVGLKVKKKVCRFYVDDNSRYATNERSPSWITFIKI